MPANAERTNIVLHELLSALVEVTPPLAVLINRNLLVANNHRFDKAGKGLRQRLLGRYALHEREGRHALHLGRARRERSVVLQASQQNAADRGHLDGSFHFEKCVVEFPDGWQSRRFSKWGEPEFPEAFGCYDRIAQIRDLASAGLVERIDCAGEDR